MTWNMFARICSSLTSCIHLVFSSSVVVSTNGLAKGFDEVFADFFDDGSSNLKYHKNTANEFHVKR